MKNNNILSLVEAELDEIPEHHLREFAYSFFDSDQMIQDDTKFCWVCDGQNNRRYVIFYWIRRKTLAVCGAFKLDPNGNFINMVWEGIDGLAKSKGCEEVIFCSTRAGLIKRSQQNGYKLERVQMRKRING